MLTWVHSFFCYKWFQRPRVKWASRLSSSLLTRSRPTASPSPSSPTSSQARPTPTRPIRAHSEPTQPSSSPLPTTRPFPASLQIHRLLKLPKLLSRTPTTHSTRTELFPYSHKDVTLRFVSMFTFTSQVIIYSNSKLGVSSFLRISILFYPSRYSCIFIFDYAWQFLWRSSKSR